MLLEPAPADVSDSISRLAAPGSPVMIFELDAAGVAREAAPARRCDVRLTGCVRDRSADQRELRGELTAILVLRGLTPSRLLACVRAVTRGGGSMAPELLCQMFPASQGERLPYASDGQLTSRELAVLRMLADGEVTRGIAQQLNYSERTVKNIVRDVLVKLNCRTRAHAVALATRQGVI